MNITAGTKTQLARLYRPKLKDPVRWLIRIMDEKGVTNKLETETGYKRDQKHLTAKQVRIIIEKIGKPNEKFEE